MGENEQKKALVIGGGVTGMQAAKDLADSGVYTYLVERNEGLGGRAKQLSRTFKTHECKADGCCIDYCWECIFTATEEEMDQSENIEVLTGTEVENISGTDGNFQVDIATGGEKKSLKVNGIMVATGSRAFDPSGITAYGYTAHDDVITFLELEKRLVELRQNGNWNLTKPSDGAVPKVINFFLCVGSRDTNHGNKHCSIVCCTYAIGQAKEIKKYLPDTQVYVHYMDLRASYRGFEEHYEEAQALGVDFVRGRAAEVITEGDGLIVKAEDMDIGETLEIDSDLVVLCVGQEPHDGTDGIAGMLGLPLLENGFIGPDGEKEPAEVPGVAVAGCALGPRGIRYSVEDAKRAAEELIEYLEGVE